MIPKYYSGWQALNLPDENGKTADWHPLLFWDNEPKKYDFNEKLGDWGIKKRYISFLNKEDFVANFARAIADLVLNNDTKELKNCVSDYLDDDEAKELYENLKKFKILNNVENFLKYELTKFYFLENKD